MSRTFSPVLFIFLMLFVELAGLPTQAAVNVAVETLKPGLLREMLTYTGETRPLVETYATSDLAGRIEKILVENGDPVSQGQVVVTIERERYQIALDQAEATLKIAEQRAKEAARDFVRTKVLFDKKAVNDKTYDSAETASIMAENQVKQAKAAFDLGKLNVERCSIRAPISGYFVNRTGFIGQGVNPGTILGKIVELKRLFIEARIPEHQIRSIKIGQDCLIEQRPGRVSQIDLYADAGRTFLVKIQMANEDLHFKANMFVKGNLILKEYRDVPLLPVEAMLTEGEKTFVFIVQGKSARRLPIEIVAREGNLLYVHGVETGQIIVVAGQHSLKDGDEVLLPEKN